MIIKLIVSFVVGAVIGGLIGITCIVLDDKAEKKEEQKNGK